MKIAMPLFVALSLLAFAMASMCAWLSRALAGNLLFNYFVWATALFYTIGFVVHYCVPVFLFDTYFHQKDTRRIRRGCLLMIPLVNATANVALILSR